MARKQETPWVEALSADELAFLRRFLLSSGSLKEMAENYGVSYPTIRARLDGLIEKVRALGEGDTPSQMRLLVRKAVRDGEMELGLARRLLKAHDEDLRREDE